MLSYLCLPCASFDSSPFEYDLRVQERCMLVMVSSSSSRRTFNRMLIMAALPPCAIPVPPFLPLGT